MLKFLRTTIALLMLATGACQTGPTLSAEQLAEQGTPEQQELARKVVDAMSDKNFAAMKQLIAPSTLKCIGEHEDFLHYRIKKQFDLPISKDYQLTITKLPPDAMNPSQYSTYPMPATHLMGMEFATADGGTATVNETIGRENGKWYEAQPCPTELGLQRFAMRQQGRDKSRARIEAAMAEVPDPLKSQLNELIAKHDNVSAWKLCVSSTKKDYPTCQGIVAMLAGEAPD
jgi:hypothetical protein